jgi:hypothetical protein
MASAGWQRRNAAARAKGYRNYYDYRMHRYGARPASEPIPGGLGPMLRGQRGPAALLRVLRSPNRVALIVEIPESNKQGQWTHMRYVVTFNNADIREYLVAIPDSLTLASWRDAIDEAGVDYIQYVSRHGHGVAQAA